MWGDFALYSLVGFDETGLLILALQVVSAMSTASGACMVSKISGMLHIRDDTAPPMLEWNAIDQLKNVSFPLTSLTNLKASKEDQPAMKLLLFYKSSKEDEKKLMLTFTNRPTMNMMKNALQTIVARLKTVIRDSTPLDSGSPSMTPSLPLRGRESTPVTLSNSLVFSDPNSLTDDSLLKNHQLQQKFLLEDKALRDVFTQSVTKYHMSLNVFWLSRLNQLRTYALTISQHRGPYNVLSTIKPVATSDNQVNVNVTRDSINDIFNTYPAVRKAYHDLVPLKISEGEFWSRFFNSKLFRRLRGDKINSTNDRGDFILDKYLYIDEDYTESPDEHTTKKQKQSNDAKVSAFIDLMGNEEDNSQKLGNCPDYTMRFTDESEKQQTTQNPNIRGKVPEKQEENEMIILMRNMNKLSSKMIHSADDLQGHSIAKDGLSKDENNEYEEELELHDLAEIKDENYVRLNINNKIQGQRTEYHHNPHVSLADLSNELKSNCFEKSDNKAEIDLRDIYLSKSQDVDKSYYEVSGLVKQNYKAVRLISSTMKGKGEHNIVSESTFQELLTFNMTVMEFLSQFWKLFLSGRNPTQLKKIFITLKNCKTTLVKLEEEITESISENDQIKQNARLKEKVSKDLVNCLRPIQRGLEKACNEFTSAVAKSNGNKEMVS